MFQKCLQILLNELKQYNPELADKQRILAITKCDTIDEELIEELEKDLKLLQKKHEQMENEYKMTQAKK